MMMAHPIAQPWLDTRCATVNSDGRHHRDGRKPIKLDERDFVVSGKQPANVGG